MLDDGWKKNMPCFSQGFSMIYINPMTYADDNIQDYISVRRGILIKTTFHDLEYTFRDDYLPFGTHKSNGNPFESI